MRPDSKRITTTPHARGGYTVTLDLSYMAGWGDYEGNPLVDPDDRWDIRVDANGQLWPSATWAKYASPGFPLSFVGRRLSRYERGPLAHLADRIGRPTLEALAATREKPRKPLVERITLRETLRRTWNGVLRRVLEGVNPDALRLTHTFRAEYHFYNRLVQNPDLLAAAKANQVLGVLELGCAPDVEKAVRAALAESRAFQAYAKGAKFAQPMFPGKYAHLPAFLACLERAVAVLPMMDAGAITQLTGRQRAWLHRLLNYAPYVWVGSGTTVGALRRLIAGFLADPQAFIDYVEARAHTHLLDYPTRTERIGVALGQLLRDAPESIPLPRWAHWSRLCAAYDTLVPTTSSFSY